MLSLFLIGTASAQKSTDDHIQAIREIGSILAEYTETVGATPFKEEWDNDDPDDDSVPVTIICNLSKNKIPDDLAYPPFSCYLMPSKEFEKYLSKRLNRKIRLPRDDRDLTAFGKQAPLFYTIQIGNGNFFVSTYILEPHKDAREIGKYWHKFEVGSKAIPSKKIEKAALQNKNEPERTIRTDQ